MTAVAVGATEIGAWEQALVAATEDAVTFARYCPKVRVVNVTGTSPIYFTTDGTSVTVGGKGTHWLPAVAGTSKTIEVKTGGNTVVKLKSAGTPSYSVEGNF